MRKLPKSRIIGLVLAMAPHFGHTPSLGLAVGSTTSRSARRDIHVSYSKANFTRAYVLSTTPLQAL
jgi:hypothetical protein